MHSKDFHDNVEIPPGFAFFDRTIDCRLAGCPSNRVNRHYHCTRTGCGYSFVRYSAMSAHERQHESGGSTLAEEQQQSQPQPAEQRPRIQVKNPAELIEALEERSEQKEMDLCADANSKTTGEQRCGAIMFFEQ